VARTAAAGPCGQLDSPDTATVSSRGPGRPRSSGGRTRGPTTGRRSGDTASASATGTASRSPSASLHRPEHGVSIFRCWEDGWGRHVANMPRPPLPVPFKTIRNGSPFIQEIVRKKKGKTTD
jgi:hypothetical protein